MELIAEKKSIDKITVNELAARADITKTTFYYHYKDIYAIPEEYENELIARLDETLNVIDREKPRDYSIYIERILSFIKDNEESYRLAARSSDLTYFSSKLKNTFYKRMSLMPGLAAFSENREKRAVQVYFFVSACVDTVIQYLKGNLCSSIDLVGETITELIEKIKNAR